MRGGSGRIWAVGLISCVCGSAGAATPPPRFSTLERFDDTSRGVVEYGYHFFDTEVGSVTAKRLGLAGQYVTGQAGFYGQLSLTSVSFKYDSGFGSPDKSESGNTALEFGAYWHKRSALGLLVLRGGLMLPTASGFGGVVANAGSAFQRLTDFVTIAPDRWAPRTSFSWSGNAGQVFYRGDFGLDLLIPTDDAGNGADSEVWAHFNLGLGVNTGPVALSAEWANVAQTDGDRDFEDRHLNSAALRIAYLGDFLQPALTLIRPLDDTDETLAVMIGLDLVQR